MLYILKTPLAEVWGFHEFFFTWMINKINFFDIKSILDNYINKNCID